MFSNNIMTEHDLNKSSHTIDQILAILAKLLKEEETDNSLFSKRNEAKKIYRETQQKVINFRIKFLLELLTDKSEKNRNLIKDFVTKLLKEDDEGYALYKMRELAKRNYQDAVFDVNRHKINYVLESLLNLLSQ